MLDYNEINRVANNFAETNERARASVVGYAAAMADIVNLQNKINEGKRLEQKYQKDIDKLMRKQASQNGQLSQADQRRLQQANSLLTAIQRTNEEYEMQLELNQKNLSVTNLITASVNTMGKGLTFVGKQLLNHSKYWFDQMKAIRETEKHMGILGNQLESFRNNIELAAFHTSDIGVETKDLAEIQGAYSDKLGRSVILQESQYETLAAMTKVLGMSNSEVGDLAASWENVGGSTEGFLDNVERMSKETRKSGLNTVAVFRQLDGIMKKVNMYKFKGGVDAMRKMAEHAEKYKMSMDTVTGVADRLFDVEGAIEMSANLQVLGGQWSQIADPMQLMFKARNDMKGLQEDLINAASGAAQWNAETKNFEISALELHRMRGAAEMTGMTLDQLRDTAIATAKVSKINMEIGGKIKDPKLMEWITSTAQQGDDGKFFVKIGTDKVGVDKLGGRIKELNKMMGDDAKMKEVAERSMTFDQRIDALIMKAKTTFLPLVEAFDTSMEPMFKSLNTFFTTHGKAITDGVGTIAVFMKDILSWVVSNPVKSILAGGLVVAGKALFEFAQWRLNGLALASGFNAATSMNGMQNGTGSGLMGGARDIAGGLSGRAGRNGTRGRMLRRGGNKIMNGGGWASLLGLGLDYGGDALVGSGMMDANGDARKMTDIASMGLQYGGMGAMIGSMIAPGIGTAIGAAIGGLGGAAYGYYDNYMANGGKGNGTMNDFISRPGADPIPFNSADTLVGLKKDGGLGKALLNKAGVGVNSSGGGGVVTFANSLKIEGSIMINTPNGDFGSLNLNDPILRREITKMVQEQLSANLAGGIRTNTKL